jgi:nitrous-oxide reductase
MHLFKRENKLCNRHNTYDESTMTATTEMKEGVISVDPRDVEGAVYYMPVPKSPHGLDVDPSRTIHYR